MLFGIVWKKQNFATPCFHDLRPKGSSKRSGSKIKTNARKKAKMIGMYIQIYRYDYIYKNTLPLIGQRAKMRPRRAAAGLVLGFRFCYRWIIQNLQTKSEKRTAQAGPSENRDHGDNRSYERPVDYTSRGQREAHTQQHAADVNAASTTAAQPVAHETVSHRIECCCTFKNRCFSK